MTKNILLVGVGGQGTILISKILTEGLIQKGYDVKMSEIHGMSQRGGSVSSQVRYGDAVQSPVIEKGSADVIVAFPTAAQIQLIEDTAYAILAADGYADGVILAVTDVGETDLTDYRSVECAWSA